VDGIHDTEEIVVKPLGKEMKGLNVYAGATIMGDGKVALILDVTGLARRARLLEESRGQSIASTDGTGVVSAGEESQSLLVARVGRNRIAIPLACIARLEEIPAGKVELAGSSEVVQYRGRIMAVVRLSTILNMGRHYPSEESQTEPLRVVVCALPTGNLGVIVDAIEDIVEENVRIEIRDGQRGLLGSAVVRDQVTDLLDINELARMAA
jgi:two-component system chemotaxis sensor kinase CheA